MAVVEVVVLKQLRDSNHTHLDLMCVCISTAPMAPCCRLVDQHLMFMDVSINIYILGVH